MVHRYHYSLRSELTVGNGGFVIDFNKYTVKFVEILKDILPVLNVNVIGNNRLCNSGLWSCSFDDNNIESFSTFDFDHFD